MLRSWWRGDPATGPVCAFLTSIRCRLASRPARCSDLRNTLWASRRHDHGAPTAIITLYAPSGLVASSLPWLERLSQRLAGACYHSCGLYGRLWARSMEPPANT